MDVPNITSEEAASFKANVAPPSAFTAAGLEYSPAMSGLQATLTRRADGRAYLRLTTDKAINDPFIDMILEASWASGRIVRDFTMLFDPPSLKQATAPTLPQTSAGASVAAKVTAAPSASTASAETPARISATSKSPVPASAPKSAPQAPVKAEAGTDQRVVVKAGDSASKIAVRTKASDVSLDQMLVALLRSNPDAFSNGNLNRLRAGAVLDLPSAEQAKSISVAEAAQTVVAQSKDFNEFRRNLAGSAPQAAVEAPNRKAAGSVDAKVEDKKPSNAAADKLTLSKGALKAKADEEAKVAKERADADAKARANELAKNIEDLKKLSASSAKAPAAAPATAASQPASTPVAPVVAATATKPAAPAVSAPASAPAAPAKAKASAPVSTMAPEAEPGLVDQLLEDPTLPLAGGGLLALIGGFAFYRRSKNKKQSAHVDSSFTESNLHSDSFFGASGGQQVDTGQAASNGSSMGYSNSQIASTDDVDPVAEADVYLAYGRDMQAEEILKAALVSSPERLAIHSKMLEIYAKRRDTASFLTGANTAFKLTDANSPEWAHICELGLSIDPENPLYQPGGASPSAFDSMEQSTALSEQATEAFAHAPAAANAADLDLDLDFSADDAPADNGVAIDLDSAPEPASEPTVLEPDLSHSLDFDISGPAELEEAPPPAIEPVQSMPEFSLSLDDLSLDMPAEAPAIETPSLDLPTVDAVNTAPAALEEVPAAKANDGMLEFDLGSLSLDLDAGDAEANAEGGDGSLETKLALAEEFVSIGDNDGARALIEEVVAEATGDLRERAQRALSNLS